jgi:hypothetical protein
MRLQTALPVFVAFIWLAGSQVARASTIIFSSLGPGGTFAGGGGFVISGSMAAVPLPEDLDLDEGGQFIAPQTVRLDTIEAGLSVFAGTSALELWLMSDIPQPGTPGRPGIVLESFSFTNLPHTNVDPDTLSVGTSTLRPVLTAGTAYWIIAHAPVEDSWGFFHNQDLDATFVHGAVAFRADGDDWSVLGNSLVPAFRVSGTPVEAEIPEPASIGLLGISLGAFIARRCSRK